MDTYFEVGASGLSFWRARQEVYDSLNSVRDGEGIRRERNLSGITLNVGGSLIIVSQPNSRSPLVYVRSDTNEDAELIKNKLEEKTGKNLVIKNGG